MTVQETKTQPTKFAAFGGRLLVRFWDWGLEYNHFLEVQSKEHALVRGPIMFQHIIFE